MNGRFTRILVIVITVVALAAPVSAQGGNTATLSGTVVDPEGAHVPGATVVVKNTATGTTSETLSNADGVFSVPALEVGTYTVTVSLTGFKTAVINDVRLLPGAAASVKATLDVGNLEETVIVSTSTDIINTQTATIASTLNVDQINRMPMATRNAVNAVTFLPGVNTSGRFELQRAPGLVCRDHLGRRQQQRQFQQVDRGDFRVGDAATGCGRSGHGDDGGRWR
jgi:hypothetical protein